MKLREPSLFFGIGFWLAPVGIAAPGNIFSRVVDGIVTTQHGFFRRPFSIAFPLGGAGVRVLPRHFVEDLRLRFAR